jgi:hypothetical protein
MVWPCRRGGFCFIGEEETVRGWRRGCACKTRATYFKKKTRATVTACVTGRRLQSGWRGFRQHRPTCDHIARRGSGGLGSEMRYRVTPARYRTPRAAADSGRSLRARWKIDHLLYPGPKHSQGFVTMDTIDSNMQIGKKKKEVYSDYIFCQVNFFSAALGDLAR